MDLLRRLLFPDPPRTIPYGRAWNITFRTAHIAATGALLGGHVFDVDETSLRTVLFLSILTGVGLTALEAYPTFRWLVELRGVMVLVKLGLLCAVPVLWDQRVPLLLAIVVIACVGSHMPRHLRHLPVLARRGRDGRGH
ncbi:MAG: hypothetical protein CMJ18_06850 [Phycisphaeraceae bacterium]|nr:hypothetical protein [Phycisphaeraceae bacterium]